MVSTRSFGRALILGAGLIAMLASAIPAHAAVWVPGWRGPGGVWHPGHWAPGPGPGPGPVGPVGGGPGRVWVAGHYNGPVFVPGHWAVR